METNKFNKQSRTCIYNKLKNERFDLIIIGGGITGASIFRDAVLRGLKTALVEAKDFSSGTSSRSSKLFHGGLRYIKSLDFHVTKEACSERNLFMELNSRLVKPIPFMIPVYRKGKCGKLAISLLLHIYDFLGSYKNFRNHTFLSKKKTLIKAPGINRKGLVGSFIYYDALVNDSRLTMDIIKEGVKNGGTAINYASVTKLTKEKGQINGIKLKDAVTGSTYVVHGDTVINATGPFSDSIRRLDDPDCDPLIVLSGGTHIVFRKKDIPLDITTTLFSPIDGRVLFLIKHNNCFLFGTTDTWSNGNPADTTLQPDDITYLMDSINLLFPDINLTNENIVSTYRGFRPLVRKKEKVKQPEIAIHPSDVSRADYYEISPSGLITVTGGKLTTARLMAKKTLSIVCKNSKKKIGKCMTHLKAIGGNKENLATGMTYWTLLCPDLSHYFKNLYDEYGIDAYELCHSLYIQYIKTGLRDPEMIRITYMCNMEMVVTLEDLIERRIGDIGWTANDKHNYVFRYKKTIQQGLSLSSDEFRKIFNAYKEDEALACLHADGRS